MEKHRLQIILNSLYFLISSDLSLSSAATSSIFSKDFFENREILFHINCYNELQSLMVELLNSGLSVSYYDFLLYEMQWPVTGNSTNPLFLHICPSNTSEVVNCLKEISKLYEVEEQPFVEATYFIQWPEFGSARLEDFISTLQKDNVQQIIKAYPMNADIYLSVNYDKQSYKLSNTSRVTLIELYSVHRNVSVVQVIWDSFSRWKVTHEYIVRKIARRWNFHTAAVRGVAFKNTTHWNGETSFVQPIILFEAISRVFNFSFVEINGTGWIGPYFTEPTTVSDAVLTGMGEQIISGEADICLQYSELLIYRSKHLFMGPRFFASNMFALFRQPPASFVRNIYIKAFHAEVWVTYLLVWTLLTASVYIALFIKRRRLQLISLSHKTVHANIAQETLLWFIGSITMQGINVSTSAFPLKIIRFSALILVIVCYNLYGSSLFSILSHQKGPIQNYEDFVQSDIPVIADFRAIRGTEILTEIFRKRELLVDNVEKYVFDPIIAAGKLMNNSVALISQKELWFQSNNGLSHRMKIEICQQYHRLDFTMGLEGCGMYMHRNSSMRKYLTFPIFMLTENGLRHRHVSFRDAENVYYCQPRNEVPSLGNNDVFTIYIVLGIGILASLGFILIEKSIA